MSLRPLFCEGRDFPRTKGSPRASRPGGSRSIRDVVWILAARGGPRITPRRTRAARRRSARRAPIGGRWDTPVARPPCDRKALHVHAFFVLLESRRQNAQKRGVTSNGFVHIVKRRPSENRISTNHWLGTPASRGKTGSRQMCHLESAASAPAQGPPSPSLASRRCQDVHSLFTKVPQIP